MSHNIQQNIDKNRLQNDILATAEFGKLSDRDGYRRTALTGTEPNKQARKYFVEQAKDVGLDIRIDEIGNIVGG